MKKYHLFIDGMWKDAVLGKTFYSYNPSTGEAYAEIAEAGAEDVDIAVNAARNAFENSEWSNMTPSDRGRLLMKVANILRENIDRLATIESTDNGLPINETKYIAIPSMIDVLEFYAGLANKIQGSTLSSPSNRFNYTLKEPLGVVGAIVPWNFPLMLTMWKLAPALAAGNTIVIKPSEHTPISILEMVKLFQEAGIPDGVINVVPGFGKDAGNALVSHPGIDKIAFTGSTKTGQLIMQTASKNITEVSLELGGKSPNIVFEDANIEHAVNGAMFGIFFAQGQVCASGTRLFVQETIYDEFVNRFIEKAQQIRVGNPLDEGTQMGPQTSLDQLEKIEYYVNKGIDEGATLLLGGERHKNIQNGYYFTPTVFGDVTNDMTIAREEIFGPVLSIIRFKNEEEVIQQANDTLYGLAAGVWTSNLQRAHRMTQKLKAGTVYVNTFSMLDTVAPFGGMKQSGIGRELGIEALQMYTTTKHVWIDLNEDGFNWYGV
ncbi:betaine-aldehyde dehydrogenase [Rummeliibacillus pycnus]|uniref:betaine-aldehyde dehydrogenase n=1 Tax=Rummeliibacillus pycnus TaxID=101070 RepID=UPI000C9C8F7E|nr:betaine-aldehyde dehydrogenase [Rummeliibacillus pycnus]